MSELKVRFGEPIHGWMEMQISTAMQKVVEEVATYHHTFVDLIFALHFRWMSEERLIQLGH